MPDVNILLYAHRSEERVHTAYRDWLEQAVSAQTPFYLALPVAMGFVRIATNRRVYPVPTPTGVALAVIDALRARDNCRLVGSGPRTWELAADLCRTTSAAGKHVADAWLAALAIEHSCEFVTRDGDFARYAASGLRWSRLELG